MVNLTTHRHFGNGNRQNILKIRFQEASVVTAPAYLAVIPPKRYIFNIAPVITRPSLYKTAAPTGEFWIRTVSLCTFSLLPIRSHYQQLLSWLYLCCIPIITFPGSFSSLLKGSSMAFNLQLLQRASKSVITGKLGRVSQVTWYSDVKMSSSRCGIGPRVQENTLLVNIIGVTRPIHTGDLPSGKSTKQLKIGIPKPRLLTFTVQPHRPYQTALSNVETRADVSVPKREQY